MNRKSILKISRPRFWSYVFGPYLIGLIAGIENFRELEPAQITIYIFFALYFLFPANLLIYGINDIFDYESDRLNSKKNNYENLLSKQDHGKITWFAILANLPFALGALWLLPTDGLAYLCLFWFFSIFYSSPPIRAKTKPFLDAGFNILYLFPGFFGYALAGQSDFSLWVFVAGASWVMAMHAFSAVPDITADRLAGMNTIATALEKNHTIKFCLFLYLLSFSFSLKILGLFWSGALTLPYLILMIKSLKTKTDQELMKIYKIFPKLNLLIGMIIFFLILIDK